MLQHLHSLGLVMEPGNFRDLISEVLLHVVSERMNDLLSIPAPGFSQLPKPLHAGKLRVDPLCQSRLVPFSKLCQLRRSPLPPRPYMPPSPTGEVQQIQHYVGCF